MKKIGLITIIDYKNYGNRLQNYAAQEVLRKLGCEVTTLLNEQVNRQEPNINRNFIDKIKSKSIKGIMKSISYRINKNRNKKVEEKRIDAFRAFSKLHINESDFILKESSISDNIESIFDYFVVGSDQVWNPIYRKGSKIDFLTFAPKNKRIAYAPSFGISNIPAEYRSQYKAWISEFAFLSVREDAGANIIKNLTNREASVLVDPTVMLTKEEWLSIAKPHKLKPNTPFLLTYFLGEVPKEVKGLISKLSTKYKLEAVNLGSYEQIERYASDPSEFIDYVNSANIFLTDSFHGAVFSIILEKQFIVFNRVSKVPSMNSRIDTLLTKFNLMDRKWESVKQSQDYFGADFSQTRPIFEYERSKAYSYLKNTLSIEDAN